MGFASELDRLVKESLDKCPVDANGVMAKDAIEAIKDHVMGEAPKLPGYDTFVACLVRGALWGRVEDDSYKRNKAARRAAGLYDCRPKVIVGNSKRVLEAYRRAYEDYQAGGKSRQPRGRKRGRKTT
jgi:hypothetical protein